MEKRKVTIYATGAAGAIDKVEGYLGEITTGMVTYVPKRGRRERAVMTFYAPFIMVAEGWGHPDPAGLYDPATAQHGNGVTTMRGRYRGCDPRWVEDFLAGPGKDLKPMAKLERGVITYYGAAA